MKIQNLFMNSKHVLLCMLMQSFPKILFATLARTDFTHNKLIITKKKSFVFAKFISKRICYKITIFHEIIIWEWLFSLQMLFFFWGKLNIFFVFAFVRKCYSKEMSYLLLHVRHGNEKVSCVCFWFSRVDYLEPDRY